MFIAVGFNGQRISSVNGKDWNRPAFGKETEVFTNVAYGNSRFAVVGRLDAKNISSMSQDGVTWMPGLAKDSKYGAYSLRGLQFVNGSFLALGGQPGGVGEESAFVMLSTDGVEWGDEIHCSGKFILRRAAYGNGLIVGVGDRGRRAVSTDGKTWTDAPNPKAVDTLINVAFGKNLFVGVGLHGMRMISSDGLKWSERIPGEEGEHLNSIAWTGKQFVAVGAGGTYLSPDGVQWTRRENKDAPQTFAYGNGIFVGVAWKGRILFSTDAITWKEVYRAESHFEAVAFGSG